MYVRRNLRTSLIMWFCWREVLFFIVLSTLVYWLYCCQHLQWAAVPFLPVGTIGTAVAFYIGFKNNSSYERLWEGRKIWGSILNLSRYFAMLVTDLPASGANSSELAAVKQRMVRRQINWCDLLRLQLREHADHWNHERVPAEVQLMERYKILGDPSQELNAYLSNNISPADREILQGKTNPAATLLKLQMSEVLDLQRKDLVSDTVAEQLLTTLSECIKEQGGSERLKTFPFPRQYAYFSGVFVWIFLVLLPFGLVAELAKAGVGLDWMVIPFSTLISWIFVTMEQVGDTSEDPFGMGLNDVPLSAICRNIEIELLEMLGETNLPAKIQPTADVLL